jgi:hypothetical protein
MSTAKKPGRPPGKPKTGGRKKGTPNKVTADVKAVAQQYGREAIESLVEIMRGTDYPPAARVSASKELLDRAYGKPQQAIEHSGKVDRPLVIVLDDEDANADQADSAPE